MIVLVFIVSTIRLSLGLDVLLAERFALNLVWSQGFA